MSPLQRKSVCSFGSLAVLFTILTDSAPAASEAPSAWQLLAGCAEKVQQLEAEVEVLRQQLREQRQASERTAAARSARSSCDAPFEISPAGIKQVKQQCVAALQFEARQLQSAQLGVESCELPYVLDARGLKSFKRACVEE